MYCHIDWSGIRQPNNVWYNCTKAYLSDQTSFNCKFTRTPDPILNLLQNLTILNSNSMTKFDCFYLTDKIFWKIKGGIDCQSNRNREDCGGQKLYPRFNSVAVEGMLTLQRNYSIYESLSVRMLELPHCLGSYPGLIR